MTRMVALVATAAVACALLGTPSPAGASPGDPGLRVAKAGAQGGGGGGPPTDDTNAPEDYGSGYGSWGTAGGATLGAGDGTRANFIGGNYASTGSTFFGLEGYYIFGVDRDFDVFLGGRLSVWYFGLIPGARLRYRVMESDALHLSIDVGAYAGFLLGAGIFPFGFNVGRGPLFATQVYGVVAVDPGLMASYFVKDNMEILFGAYLPFTFAGGPFFTMTFGVDLRAGFAYTLKTINLGFFVLLDVVPGVGVADWPGVPGLRSGFIFGGGLNGGIQYRF